MRTQEDLLSESINIIDNFSQQGFTAIETIASLALQSLESPEGHRDCEIIAQALTHIIYLASDFENCINAGAENHGCNYKDKARSRRRAAHAAFRGNKTGEES